MIIYWPTLPHTDCDRKSMFDIFDKRRKKGKCMLCGKDTLLSMPDNRGQHKFIIIEDREVENFIKGLF